MGLIYQIKCKTCGRIYVGMTKKRSLEGRDGRYPKGWDVDSCNSQLRDDANRYGKDAFEVSTEECDDSLLPERETELISKYKREGVSLYNNLGAHPSFGVKKGQRQRFMNYVRLQLLLRFNVVDDELVDLWTKTSSGTNRDGHSAGHNAKNSKAILEAERGGQADPPNYRDVLKKVENLIEDVRNQCPNFGYTGSSPKRIYTNMKWMKQAVAFRIACRTQKDGGGGDGEEGEGEK